MKNKILLTVLIALIFLGTAPAVSARCWWKCDTTPGKEIVKDTAKKVKETAAPILEVVVPVVEIVKEVTKPAPKYYAEIGLGLILFPSQSAVAQSSGFDDFSIGGGYSVDANWGFFTMIAQAQAKAKDEIYLYRQLVAGIWGVIPHDSQKIKFEAGTGLAEMSLKNEGKRITSDPPFYYRASYLWGGKNQRYGFFVSQSHTWGANKIPTGFGMAGVIFQTTIGE